MNNSIHFLSRLFLASLFIAFSASCSKDDDDEKNGGGTNTQNPNRYRQEIFSSTTRTNVAYTADGDLTMDIFRPVDDNNRSRPVILFAHSGSFFDGARNSQEMLRLCESFAKRGYVTVNLDYRLGSGIQVLNDSIQMLEVIVRGAHDMKAAVRFLRKTFSENNTYGIDTSKIVIGGSGAGATLALHTGFMNNQQVVPLHIAQILLAEGGLHGLRGHLGFSNKVHGVINLAGGINSLDFIEFGGPAVISIHGNQDDNFPYFCGKVFESFPPTTTRLRLCGGGRVVSRASSLQIPSKLMSIDGAGHRPWVNSSGVPQPLMDEVIDEISDFLYTNIITGGE